MISEESQDVSKGNKYSTAFNYFRQGKTPLDVVMDGILDPDEAKELYEKFLKLSRFKTPEVLELEGVKGYEEVKLTVSEWGKLFKSFYNGKHPVDVVIENNLEPEKVEYAYLKFLELIDKHVSLTDHELSLAFYFFEKGYTPLDLSSRGILSHRKAKYAYKKYLEAKKGEKGVVGESGAQKSMLEMEIPDRLVILFFIASLLAVLEHLTASIVFLRTGTFGINPLILGLSFFFGPKIGIITSMLLTVLIYGLLMFASFLYVKRYQNYPLLLACVLEVIYTLSHALHL